MERRAFLMTALAATGMVLFTAGAAQALPALPAHDALAPEGEVEQAWWYRRYYWRPRYRYYYHPYRRWHRWRRWRRWHRRWWW